MRGSRSNTVNSLVLSFSLIAACASSSSAKEAAWQQLISEGDTFIAHGELNKAESSFRQARQLLSKTPHNTEELSRSSNKLANVLALEGKTDEAEITYQRSLSQLEKSYGKDSQKITPTLMALGSFFEAEGDHSSAMAFYQRAININEKSYSQYSPAIVGVVHHPQASLSSIGLTPYGPASAALPQKATLSASTTMLKKLPNTRDLIKKDDNSNSDLLSDFKSHFLNPDSAQQENPRTSGDLQSMSSSPN